jgi:NADH-ubiquinone oxidoreductase chain 4
VILLIGTCLRRTVAIRQTDIKSIVAFSSVGHMGVLMAGFIIFQEIFEKGAFVIVLAHGFCSSALFFLVNVIYERLFTRQISALRGLINMFAGFRFWWFLFLTINFAAPPFLRLAGEFMLLIQIAAMRKIFLILFLVVRFIVGVFSFYLFSSVIHGKISLH